jgi:hypothetical protein
MMMIRASTITVPHVVVGGEKMPLLSKKGGGF